MEQKHPERIKKNHSRWREKNPEYRAKWQKENPEKVADMGNKRRATKYANTSLDEMLTSTERSEILKTANGHCHYELVLLTSNVTRVSGLKNKDNFAADISIPKGLSRIIIEG